MEPEISLPCSQKTANSEVVCNISFYGEDLLVPSQTYNLEGHTMCRHSLEHEIISDSCSKSQNSVLLVKKELLLHCF